MRTLGVLAGALDGGLGARRIKGADVQLAVCRVHELTETVKGVSVGNGGCRRSC